MALPFSEFIAAFLHLLRKEVLIRNGMEESGKDPLRITLENLFTAFVFKTVIDNILFTVE